MSLPQGLAPAATIRFVSGPTFDGPAAWVNTVETSLHQSLKATYAQGGCPTEVRLGDYRIDVVREGELIEIQHSSLSAIRDKVAALLVEHRVRVVKPIVMTKRLIKRSRKGGPVTSRRLSPKRGKLLDLFDELVHFTRVFPHPRLVLEVPLIDIEEWRYPGHGRRRRWRDSDYVVEDRKLIDTRTVHRFATGADLVGLVPTELPDPFNTADLARALDTSRHVARQMAFCFRVTGAARWIRRRRTGHLYKLCPRAA